MKTKEELNALKEEVEALNRKLHELTEEELKQVSGGLGLPFMKKKKLYCVECGYVVCTFPEGRGIQFGFSMCPQCHAMDSLKVGDA